MSPLHDTYVALRDFLELGGPVLVVIVGTILAMWTMIVERIIYFRGEHRRALREARRAWADRMERSSWHSHRVREAMISRVRVAAIGPTPLIRGLVALCPLLGLMGTVTGMIEVFDVLSLSGTGNARSMAAGVSRATIPTMAGMVGALSGVFAVTLLDRTARREAERLEESLTIDA